MNTSLIVNTARSVSHYAALSDAPAIVTGGWATGKTRLAVATAVQYSLLVTGDVWLVGETTESARHLDLLLGEATRGEHRISVLSAEDYEERRRQHPPHPAHPAFVIYDDADRYKYQPIPSANTFHLSNGPLGTQAGARFTLDRSRTRDRTVHALTSAGLPGVPLSGTTTQRYLQPSMRPRTERLVRALNRNGLACIAHPARRDARRTVLYSTNDAVRTLNHTYLDDLDAPSLRKNQPTRVAVSISTQRSGQRNAVSPDEAALPTTPSLLEDLAPLAPEITVIASLDADLEHLTRLAATATFGAVIVTTWGSPSHRALDNFTIPSW